MRSGKTSAWLAAITAVLLMVAAVPVAAQTEEFPVAGSDAPLEGYTRSDGTIVLTDDLFCRFLLGSLWAPIS